MSKKIIWSELNKKDCQVVRYWNDMVLILNPMLRKPTWFKISQKGHLYFIHSQANPPYGFVIKGGKRLLKEMEESF